MTICGVPEQAWPYACSIDNYNSVRFDPVSGKLWVAPVRNDYGVMVERFQNFELLIPYDTYQPINWYTESDTANGSMVRRDVGSATQNWFCPTPATYGTRLTCPDDPCFAGWYRCILHVRWLTTNPTGIRETYIRLNGTGAEPNFFDVTNTMLFVGNRIQASPAGFWTEQVSVREIYLRPGDYIQAMVRHTAYEGNPAVGVNLAVCGSMSVRWVGSEDPNPIGNNLANGRNTVYPVPLPRSGNCSS